MFFWGGLPLVFHGQFYMVEEPDNSTALLTITRNQETMPVRMPGPHSEAGGEVTMIKVHSVMT